MVGILNLYLDPELSYTWREASLIVAKLMGTGIQYGSRRATNIHTWIHKYLTTSKLPTHRYGQHSVSILDDKDFALNIQEHLLVIVKDGYIQAQDIVDYIVTPEVQAKLSTKNQFGLLSVGSRNLSGVMVRRRRACMLMVINERMWWSIKSSLLRGGRSTRSGWSCTITMEMLTQCPLDSLSPKAINSVSFSSPMMNPHSI